MLKFCIQFLRVELGFAPIQPKRQKGGYASWAW